MIRKFLSIVMIIVLLIGAFMEKKKISVDDIYMSVLKSEINFISEDNEEMSFGEFMCRYDGGNAKVSYALIDFDSDGENEMIVFVEIPAAFYLILNYEDGVVYGFEDVLRGMQSITEDGTYIGSGGADAHAICRSTFQKNERIVEVLAESDWGKYIVGGKSATEQEYNDVYEKELNSKKKVNFKVFMEKYQY